MPLAIRNYGHFWNQALVNWGNPGRNRGGNLLGYRTVNGQARVTDFREQIGIYVLYGENREVVYIGQTGSGRRRLFLRLRDHTRDHLRDRWSNFSWFGFRRVNNDSHMSNAQSSNSKIQANSVEALNEIESVLLQLFEPRLNKQGPRWREAEEYLQYVEAEHGEDTAVPDALDQIKGEILELRKLIEGK